MFIGGRVDDVGVALDVSEEVVDGLVGVLEVQSLEFSRLILAEEVSEGQPVRESLRARTVGEVRRNGWE